MVGGLGASPTGWIPTPPGAARWPAEADPLRDCTIGVIGHDATLSIRGTTQTPAFVGRSPPRSIPKRIVESCLSLVRSTRLRERRRVRNRASATSTASRNKPMTPAGWTTRRRSGGACATRRPGARSRVHDRGLRRVLCLKLP